MAGEVGVLRLRVSDGDGSGQTIQEVPVRVGTLPSIDIYSKGDWLVNSTLPSYPTAWVENTGNDLAILALNVANPPSGWSVDYPETVVISPGQVIGLPISLLPDNNWDNTSISVTIEITHPTLGMQTISLTVVSSNFAFTSSPVITGVVGESATVLVSNTDIVSDDGIVAKNNELVITIPAGKTNLTLTSTNGSSEYYHTFLWLFPPSILCKL